MRCLGSMLAQIPTPLDKKPTVVCLPDLEQADSALKGN
ncbi:hypothetical protein PAUR_b0716 [Pseudoalteromonas aurantia 208]|uniref:Uncharacterized protein n=1 Tax=Pseudoalteromonas aurantia 208 TaxID=1314867 RepID=A0ABR9EJN7_9GAMM|nr:hypothetical protein [Pseudoalteromonas aurantia 208]